MDKYTYNVKAEKIQKLVKKGEYAAAVKIAETVDWEEVHSVRLLTITAAAYERVRDYKGAIELLQMAYDESAVGKRILYKLTGLAIADRDVELAQNYYEMYLQEAPEENGRYLLRYLLAELKGESLDKRIAILETYRKYEFEEEWALRLAELYDEAGIGDACVKLCDEIILWFGVGEYVDAALKLKSKYAPLSAEQQDKLDNREFYEQRYQEVADEYREKDEVVEEPAEDGEEEPASEEEQAETKPAGSPLLPEPKSDAWRGRIIFVGADTLEKAVPEILAQLNAYHEKAGTEMAVTRIPAVKFNRLGMEASRPHIAEKDLIVDGAAALSDELLREILSYVKEDGTKTVFALTDTPTELAYLDNRLGAVIKEEELPDIDTGLSETPELNLDIDAVMDDEPAVDLGGTTKEIVPQVKAALGENDEPVLDERAAVSDTVKFDKGVVAEEAAVAAAEAVETAADTAAETVETAADTAAETVETAAEAVETAAETAEALPEKEEAAVVLPESEEEAAPVLPEISPVILPEAAAEILSENVSAAALPETDSAETLPKIRPAIILPEDDDDYRQETMEDFFRAQDEAASHAEEEQAAAETVKQDVNAVIADAGETADGFRGIFDEKPEMIQETPEEIEKDAKDLIEEAKKAVEERAEAAAESAAAAEEKTDEAAAESAAAAEEKTDEVETAFAEKAEALWTAIEKEPEEIPEEKVSSDDAFTPVTENAEDLTAAETEADAFTPVETEADAFTPVETETDAFTPVDAAAGTVAAAAGEAVKDDRELVSEAFAEPEDPQEALRRKARSIPGSMTPESFIAYAKNYLTSIDCVLEEDGESALMNAAEYRLAEGNALTKEEAENIIEAAADLSEKKGGLFARRYNKEGCLILKTKFIV